MIENFDMKVLVEPALSWFIEHKRELPWRMNRDPYRIWVSEIMLQQTRVEAVKPYYDRFMTELPSIAALAECSEDRLLKLWEGLGYYSRVRNMNKAARQIVEEYQGEMPHTYEEIVKLPGIGPYTAGAIASIAFEEAVPAVDGNVLRIISRVTEDDSDILKDATKKKVSRALLEVMPQGQSGAFNQALMEIGATVCVPNGMPKCQECPWHELCQARIHGTIGFFPVKTKAKERRIEEKTVLIIRDGEKIALGKRPAKGLLAGLYELPNLEGHLSEENVLDYTREQGLLPLQIKKLPDAKHIFSHVEWHMTGYMIYVADVDTVSETSPNGNYILTEIDTIQQEYPIPAAFEKYVELVNISIGMKK